MYGRAVLPVLALSLVAADYREVVRTAKEAVVVLDVDRGVHGRVGGSGFAVGDGTLIVTAYHVVEHARSVRVLREGSGVADLELGALEIVSVDPDHDLALLRIDRPLPTLVVANDAAPGPGSPVLAVGSPQGLGLAFTDGIVSRVHEWKGIRVLQHSAPLSPGYSGGPLLDEQGEVVGANNAGLSAEAGQNVNFAVAAMHVRALIAHPVGPAVNLTRPIPDLERSVTAAHAWVPPEGQPLCASAEEPAWPFAERLPLYEMASVTETSTGVCRHGRAGPHLVYARYTDNDARDAALDSALAGLEASLVAGSDPCRREGRLPRPAGPADLVTARNRDVLYVWLRAEAADPADLCSLADRLSAASKP